MEIPFLGGMTLFISTCKREGLPPPLDPACVKALFRWGLELAKPADRQGGWGRSTAFRPPRFGSTPWPLGAWRQSSSAGQ
jgi:hypothetical protein